MKAIKWLEWQTIIKGGKNNTKYKTRWLKDCLLIRDYYTDKEIQDPDMKDYIYGRDLCIRLLPLEISKKYLDENVLRNEILVMAGIAAESGYNVHKTDFIHIINGDRHGFMAMPQRTTY